MAHVIPHYWATQGLEVVQDFLHQQNESIGSIRVLVEIIIPRI